MLAGQVLSALRARGQATLESSAANTAGASPRLLYQLEEAVDPVNEGPWERPPLGPGLPPSIHASGVDCWSGLVESLGEPTMSTPSYTSSRVPFQRPPVAFPLARAHRRTHPKPWRRSTSTTLVTGRHASRSSGGAKTSGSGS